MKSNEDTMINEISLDSIAFRSVYEQRACPPDELLFAANRSEEMITHLGYCRYCNERLALTKEDQAAWQQLVERLKPVTGSVKKSDNQPASGQIWSLDNKLSNWGPYARYYTPPLVFVLQSQDKGQTFRVAQTCAEYELMGDDGADIKLGDDVGFVETWNVYSVHRDDLIVCRGTVGKSIVQQVLMQVNNQPVQATLPPVIYKFRELEVQLGAFIAMQALSHVMAEVEAPALQPVSVNAWLEGMFGSFSDIYNALKEKYKVPRLDDTIQDLLWGARDPGFATALSMSSATAPEYVNIVSKTLNGEMRIQTVRAKIKDRYRPDNTYFIEGELLDEFPTGLRLLAWLSYNDNLIGESIVTMANDSPYFDFKFCDIPKEACELKNVKFFLVTP